jgi:hypothetical protein
MLHFLLLAHSNRIRIRVISEAIASDIDINDLNNNATSICRFLIFYYTDGRNERKGH